MSYFDDDGGICHCGALSTRCDVAGEHVGPFRHAAAVADAEARAVLAIERTDPRPPRDYAAEPCACAERNAFFRSLGLPPGTCPPCSKRSALGLAANTNYGGASRAA